MGQEDVFGVVKKKESEGISCNKLFFVCCCSYRRLKGNNKERLRPRRQGGRECEEGEVRKCVRVIRRGRSEMEKGSKVPLGFFGHGRVFVCVCMSFPVRKGEGGMSEGLSWSGRE